MTVQNQTIGPKKSPVGDVVKRLIDASEQFTQCAVLFGGKNAQRPGHERFARRLGFGQALSPGIGHVEAERALIGGVRATFDQPL